MVLDTMKRQKSSWVIVEEEHIFGILGADYAMANFVCKTWVKYIEKLSIINEYLM
jgi:hypothetical protein